MTSLLIQNGAVIPCNGETRTTFTPGYVFLRGDRIAEVGAGQAPERLASEAGEIISAEGQVVIPGLINAHTHLFQTFMRGLADDKPLLRWLEAAIWPGALAMTEEDFYLAAMIGFVENLKCGATSVLSQHYVQTSPRNMDAVAEAARRSGVRARLARGYADRDPYHPKFMETPEQVLRETERLVRGWNHSAGGRVRVEFGPLIPWGCRGDTLQTIARLAKEWDVGVHIHLAETQPEVKMTLDETGARPARWLDELGVLDERWQLVHCVWLDDDEMDRIAAAGSTIVHCPVSNMYLASGVPRVVEWRRRGIPTALATDGPGSNNSQDMLEVLKFTACLQKVGTLDATALLPEDVLEMVYGGGAKAMGLDGQIGQLAPGALADITIVNLRKPHVSPVFSPQSALVYNANGNDVDTVIVNGEVSVRDGQMMNIDEAGLIAECQKAAEKMWSRAGIRK
ncbi:MAG: amidohydrolase [Chloroflexi bacterium]|nr:amidohydrolase [Chloroflexota bacterium]